MFPAHPHYLSILQALDQQGWLVSDQIMPPIWTTQLAQIAQELWQDKRYQVGEIGREQEGYQPQIRGDSICWVPPKSKLAQHDFFHWMTGLRQCFNHYFEMGLQSQEFHFARYPHGLGYKKHLDQHRDSDARKISIVYYLNQDWDEQNGGELALYQPHDPDIELARFAPIGGRIAIFASWRMPHAVLPCKATRWSITGWLRTDRIS